MRVEHCRVRVSIQSVRACTCSKPTSPDRPWCQETRTLSGSENGICEEHARGDRRRQILGLTSWLPYWEYKMPVQSTPGPSSEHPLRQNGLMATIGSLVLMQFSTSPVLAAIAENGPPSANVVTIPGSRQSRHQTVEPDQLYSGSVSSLSLHF